jgi:myosin protein heavy chain
MAGDTVHNWVWVPSEKEVFRKASIIESLEHSIVKVRYEDDTEDTVPSNVIGEVNPSSFDKADDIAELTFLNEGSVLHNLEIRYKDDTIYTYSGLFLVAINPYSNLPIYSEDYIEMYRDVPKADNKPHIFAETDQAYQNLLAEKKDQSILVTGESGAGKTENTKKILTYLAAITSKHKGSSGSFEQQIIQANPILEAFGNAQTVRNNNSSRFGKFIKIEFDDKGKIAGAHIDWYLLEKSRVIHQSNKERNYHIFYQLLSGLPKDELHYFGLEKSPSNYSYLKNANFTIPGVDDSRELKTLMKAFDIMGVSKDQCREILKIVAIILHLGNIEFTSLKAEQASFKTSVAKLTELLGVEANVFSDAILKPKVKAGRELVKQSRNATQAKFALDALSKSLYEKLFKYLVDTINENLGSSRAASNFIGVLDIAGFEIFRENSFEQLCINYTNEKLQQFFNHHMFVLEQNEYMKEDINWEFIDFGQDLQQTIDLIEKKSNPVGVFSILDEECIVPKSTDDSFFQKLNQYCNKNSSKFKPSKFNNKFTLKHYAGDVEYSVEGWIDKNRDPLVDSVLQMLSESDNQFIANLYPLETSKQSRSSFRTVSQRHKEQLSDLINLLSQTHPHFVRCIIPNHTKKPQVFDKRLVLEQLKCNGVLEGIRIVRSGFPNRIFFKEFYNRYKVLAPNSNFTNNLRTNCQIILSSMNLDSDIYRVGSTKVFFKAGVLADLELKRDVILKTMFTEFNSICRGLLKRKAINRKLMKVQASQILMEAFTSYNRLNQNPWFTLYANLKPLLESSQQVNKTKQISDHIKALEGKLKELENQNVHMSDKHSAVLKEKELSIEESHIRETELKSSLDTTKKLMVNLEHERDDLKKYKEELAVKLKSFEVDFDKGQKLVKMLEKEKAQLFDKIKELEVSLKETEQSQKNNIESFSKFEEELNMLKTLLQAKDTQINILSEKLSNSNRELESNMSELNSKYSNANTRIKQLMDENKVLNLKLKNLESSSSQYGSIVYKKEQDLGHLKELLEKQAHQIKQLQNEREVLRGSQVVVDKELSSVKSDMSELQHRYKQLEHEAREARDLLQRKISDEITFHRGKQEFDNQTSMLRAEIERLEKELRDEKSRRIPLVNEIRELRSENENLQNDRKIVDVRTAQGAFRAKSLNSGTDPDLERMRDNKELLIREYAQMRLQLNESSAILKKETIEKNRMKADMKLLHTRLASETFDKQQLKIQVNRIKESLSKGETPNFDERDEHLAEENQKLHRQIQSLKVDLDLERKAAERTIRYVPKEKLRDTSNTYRSDSSNNDMDNFKVKYEESQAKLRILERNQSQESYRAKQIVSSNQVDKKGYDELLKIYQANSKTLLTTLQELSESKSEISKLNKAIESYKITIADYKTKDVEALSSHLAREELSRSQLKLEALESKNGQLSQSVKLYKTRAEEYFSKLESAEVAIRNSKHAEKFSQERLNEASDMIKSLKKDFQTSETAIVKLNTTISQLKGDIEGKDADLSKMYSSNRFLQEEIHHYQERLEKETSTLKNKLLTSVNKLTNELNDSLRKETDLKKSLGSLEVDYNRLKEQKGQEIRELIKEKTYLTKHYNDLKDENEVANLAQKDLEVKLRSLMKQIGNLNESVDDLITERDSLQRDKRKLEESVKELSGEYAKFDNERELKSSTIDNLNNNIEKYANEVENLKIEIKKMNHSRDKLNSIIDDEKQKNIMIKEENQSLGKFTENLKGRISELEDKIEDLKNDDAWTEKLSKLESKLKAESDLKSEFERSTLNLRRSVDELKDQVDKQHQKINDFEDVKTKYELKISELFNAINKWQSADSQSKLIIKRAEREVRYLQEHSMELENELNEWKDKFEMFSTKKRTLATNDEVFI